MTTTEPTSLAESLRKEVETLHALRMAAAAKDAAIKAARAAFEQTIAHDLQMLESTKRAIEAADAAVRGLALVMEETEGVKKAHGVEVVTTKDYLVDEAAGLEWAKVTGMCLIPQQLDVKAAKKMAAVTELPFVTVQLSKAVRVASDLSKALEAA